MNILQYDLNKYSFEEVYEVTKYLQSHNFEVLAIPKDFDLLLDVDTYTLNFKTGTPARIDKNSIDFSKLKDQQKEIINNM